MRTNHYVVKSLELHLFFGRIMKEHALFLRAGFTAANPEFSEKAEYYRKEFEELLRSTVALSDGNVSKSVLCSGEVVTEFTLLAEQKTECLTSIPIDTKITEAAGKLSFSDGPCNVSPELLRRVRQLNRNAVKLLEGLIDFKKKILQCVARGEIFTANYPLLIDHILREAQLYLRYVQMLETSGRLPNETMREIETFWNRIMMEHAQFIRGLLDPCEDELIDAADGFAKSYCALLEISRGAQDKAMTELTLEKTEKFRDFKAAGADGIQSCRIRSVILPLLADHVLREANHYIRLLK